ncbi:hypothetical protein [Nocardioides sp. WS12]|uniref:hypothetical protein n=1 Tax=Nocardioides sp. WS12 TaxID=2486272 RepID=UPI0015FCD3A9|nr:hypothetical protein [Nocardioides sp. WS12]
MSVWKNRTTAVVAGAVVIVGLGATGATAARLITSLDIKNDTIQSVDVRNGTLTRGDIADGTLTGIDIADGSIRSADIATGGVGTSEIVDGTIGLGDLSPAAKSGLAPAEGTTGVLVDTLGTSTPITHIGGPINANNTDLETGLMLPAGKYLVTVDGAFKGAASSAPAIDVYPQLSLWLDKNDDGDFQWDAVAPEGDISPNALMPNAANRHISVSGSSVITLSAPTYVGLLAFGYASDTSDARSGEINVIGATITATPLN